MTTTPDSKPGLRTRFREFRWTRPFWGGLFTMFGGLAIAWWPLGPVTDIIHVGVGGVFGFICALVLFAMGVLMWFAPSQRILAALVAVVVSLASFPLTNLGGFIVGMMAGIIGGCLAFAWVPDKQGERDRAKAERQPTPPPGDQAPAWDAGSFTERV